MDENETGIRQVAAERVDQAAELFLQGKHSAARQELEAALRINPRNATAHGNLGYIYLTLREPERAIPYLERALELEPDLEGITDALANARTAAGLEVADTDEEVAFVIDDEPIVVESKNPSPEAASEKLGLSGPVLFVAGFLLVIVLAVTLLRPSGTPQTPVETMELELPPPVQPLDADPQPEVQTSEPESIHAESTDAKSTDAGSPDAKTPDQQVASADRSEQPVATSSKPPSQPVTRAEPETDTTTATVTVSETAETKTADVEPVEEMPAAAPAGDYEIQLGAFGAGEDAAMAAWQQLAAANPRLQSLTPRVEPAEVEGQGVLYRLKAGPLDEDTARAICDGLNAAGQACFPARR